MLFGGVALVVGGWELVGWGKESHLHFYALFYSGRWERGVGPGFQLVALVWVGMAGANGLCNHRFAHKKVVEDFYRAIRDLTCGALVIPLVVIRLGVTGPKKTRFVCLLDVFLSPKSPLFFYKLFTICFSDSSK